MMNETYTTLMMQQHLSEDADAAFYEKLESTQPTKRTNPVLRIAAIAACVCLLIPVTVWAAESIFGITLITQFEGKDFRGVDSIAYQTQVENVENIPITEFSQYLQELEEPELVYFNTWEEAEQEIGIDLLSNPILTDEYTNAIKSFYTGKKTLTLAHCQGRYQTADSQLFSVILEAKYYRNKTQFWVSANMTAENPQMTEEMFQIYHGFGVRYYPANKTDGISVEQYTTENGIPVMIVFPQNEYSFPEAYFSVNNVSYHVDICGYEIYSGETENEADERALSVLKEVLEGFTLE